MRHRSTKERRAERHEFVYMYRAEIAALWALDSRNQANTYYVDIYLTLRRDYMKVFKIKNW
jgi:hypothetical protein